jgi:hypothetical protein
MPQHAHPASVPDICTQSHQQIQRLFDAFALLRQRNDSAKAEKQAVADDICLQLTLHARMARETLGRTAQTGEKFIDNGFGALLSTLESLVVRLATQRIDTPIHNAVLIALEEHVAAYFSALDEQLATKAQVTNLEPDELVRHIENGMARLAAQHRQAFTDSRAEDEEADPVGRPVDTGSR